MKIAVYHNNTMSKDNFSWGWIKELRKRNIRIYLFDTSTIDLEKIEMCDGVMWHWNHTPDEKQYAKKILYSIHFGMNKPIYPNINSCWHYDDKVAQHYLLDSINIPQPPTFIFWDKESAIKFLRQADFPLVFKLTAGAGSVNVVKVDGYSDSVKLVNLMFNNGIFPYTSFNEYKSSFFDKLNKFPVIIKQFSDYLFANIHPLFAYHFELQKNYIYLQQFLPNNSYDIRVTVIGNRAFGVLRHNRVNDFRASGSGNFEVDPANIPIEAIKLSFTIAKKLDLTSCAIDYIKDENDNWLVSELSYCHPIYMVTDCPGYWDKGLLWHDDRMRPEEAHVEDFINMISSSRK